MSLSPVQHLFDWFIPVRRQLVNLSALDRLAGRPVGKFARFLNAQAGVTFERTDLTAYYPLLQLLGYLPPGNVWVPTEPLTAAESSSDLREWFTEKRRALINFHQLDKSSKRPIGIISRWLANESSITFKIIGIDVYYPALQLLGFSPPVKYMDNSIDYKLAAEHLLTWFTPERRSFIKPEVIDVAAQQPLGTLLQFLAGFPSVQQRLRNGGLQAYYPSLAVLGYSPTLDLSKDVSVQQHLSTQQKPSN